MAQSSASASAEVTAARKRTRSPAYPYVNLKEALERAEQFYGHEGRNAANINVAGKHWGFADGSSAMLQTVAALISFGLMQDEGTGERRAVRLTTNALRILLDKRPDSIEREELIKQAALTPKIHRQLWDKWETIPSDASLRHALLLDWETPFNENAVDYFIKEFRDTIAFAKLSKSDKVGTRDEETPSRVKVGDSVQWVSQGIEQFRELKRVKGFSEDGAFAFLEGESTGVPVGELEIREAPALPPPPAGARWTRSQLQPPAHAAGGSVMRDDVYSLDDGRQVVISWPSQLPAYEAENIKAWLSIVEKKIARSATPPDEKAEAAE